MAEQKYVRYFERIEKYWIAIQPLNNPNNKAVIIRCYGNKALNKVDEAFKNSFNITTFSGESFGASDMEDVKNFYANYTVVDTINFKSQDIAELYAQVKTSLK